FGWPLKRVHKPSRRAGGKKQRDGRSWWALPGCSLSRTCVEGFPQYHVFLGYRRLFHVYAVSPLTNRSYEKSDVVNVDDRRTWFLSRDRCSSRSNVGHRGKT